jgi:hypothetical protein
MQIILTALLFVFVIALSCSPTKIKLSVANGASRELGYRSGPVKATNADSNQAAYARQLGMDSFKVIRFNHYPSFYSASASRIAIYAGDYNEHLIRVISGTPQKIPIENFDTEILFLLGKKSDGSYALVADQNNNKYFTDDQVYVFNNIQENYHVVGTKRLASFPHVTINNVKSYYNGAVSTFSHNLILEPTLFNFDQDSARKLSLSVISAEYMTGNFKFKGKKYRVAVRNALLPHLYFDPQLVKIKFAEAKDTTAFQKTKGDCPTHYIGDTVQLRNKQFVIKNVSPYLDYLTIQRLRRSKEKEQK